MVAAYLDSRITGDEDEDEYIFEFGRPAWPEVASAAWLAARLYLGGAGAPRRYFAWARPSGAQCSRWVLVHASLGLAGLTLLAWRRHRIRTRDEETTAYREEDPGHAVPALAASGVRPGHRARRRPHAHRGRLQPPDPLGPDAGPQPHHLRSPIVLQAMSVQSPHASRRVPGPVHLALHAEHLPRRVRPPGRRAAQAATAQGGEFLRAILWDEKA
jgi:hypothetical protein